MGGCWGLGGQRRARRHSRGARGGAGRQGWEGRRGAEQARRCSGRLLPLPISLSLSPPPPSETTYFNESYEGARKAVDDVMDAYQALLARLRWVPGRAGGLVLRAGRTWQHAQSGVVACWTAAMPCWHGSGGLR